MVQLYREGHGMNHIAWLLDSTLGKVHYILKKRGVKMRPAGKYSRQAKRKNLKNDPMVKAERLYREGKTIDEVAEELGLHRSTMGRKLRERGVPMRPVGQRPGPDWKPGKPRQPAGPPAWLDDAVGMYETGMGLVAIGDAVGSSNVTVRKWLVSAGVELRPRGGANNRRPAKAPARTETAGKAEERVRCPTCRGTGHPGVKRPGYGWMPIWMMYPNGEGWAL